MCMHSGFYEIQSGDDPCKWNKTNSNSLIIVIGVTLIFLMGYQENYQSEIMI